MVGKLENIVTDMIVRPKVWIERERIGEKVVRCLTVIIKTSGCRWRSCFMCSYYRDSYPSTDEMLISQINYALSKKGDSRVLKIFTSGSFFDDREVSSSVRDYISHLVEKLNFEKLIVESRPEFIEPEKLTVFESINLEVAMGLESASDYIREKCINKGFTLKDFKNACNILKNSEFRVRCYLLLKPPFLSEREAIDDIIKSIDKVRSYVDTFSINLTNVQRGTLVEKLWKNGLFRPPWLWSALEILKTVEDDVICDPVAAGKKRGPHNCGKCDFKFANAIKLYSLYKNNSYLNLSCNCYTKWKKAIELEDFTRISLWS